MQSNKLKTIAIEIAGWLLILIGIAAIFLPGPGLLALFAGLALLSTRYEWAERHVEPVREIAFKTAKESVSSVPRILFSLLLALGLVCLGIVWGVGTDVPSWWPLADKYWLVGGWGTGGTLIGSGIIATGMLVYSYLNFRPRSNT